MTRVGSSGHVNFYLRWTFSLLCVTPSTKQTSPTTVTLSSTTTGLFQGTPEHATALKQETESRVKSKENSLNFNSQILISRKNK